MQASDKGCHRLLGSLCRVRVVWDEANLHQLETTKSPKQKITEPKTPYYAPDDGILLIPLSLLFYFRLFLYIFREGILVVFTKYGVTRSGIYTK